jgi:hypothetical protein
MTTQDFVNLQRRPHDSDGWGTQQTGDIHNASLAGTSCLNKRLLLPLFLLLNGHGRSRRGPALLQLMAVDGSPPPRHVPVPPWAQHLQQLEGG